MEQKPELPTESEQFMRQHAVRVLLIDDQPIVGETVRRMLEGEQNLEFRYLSDPTQALRVAEEWAPTVILQDLVMPQIDGMTLIKFFRANPATQDIPMIMLSSREEPITKAEAFAIGANDYLVKLPDRIELIARIRHHSQGFINLIQRNEAYQALAGVAHDIKNILTGIRGGTYMMDQALEGGDQAMLKLGWHVVKVSQDRINQLVFNMLDFSKDRTPAYETVNLAETLGNVRDLIALRAQDAEVEVCLEVHPDAETIEAEGLSIHRCVLNLAGNALDALPDDRPGKVTIRARSDESPDLLALDVQDNGVGIPPEDCAKLFQAFHSSKGAKGTGLGLAVSRKIAVEHGGEITIESTVGVGTTFTIHLPRCKPA
ncbi:MAG: hybrid sensor histidine kinase/response regulator [Candidatus Lernaella stagnicola]|nr:hybrid sensor histidine kinase/response regulator [Candidatus Lernaella stagnicola]